jgi:hypothetical protein
MAGHSNFMEKQILDWLFKRTALAAAPTTLYVSLHSADPADTGASELAATGAYARASITTDTNNTTHTSWSAVDTSTNPPYSRMSNQVAVTFPEATANWNAGTAITFFGVWDAATTGNFLFGGQIGAGVGVVVLNGVTLSIPAGNIYHELD